MSSFSEASLNLIGSCEPIQAIVIEVILNGPIVNHPKAQLHLIVPLQQLFFSYFISQDNKIVNLRNELPL